ncbi:exonuclease DPD1, chloroplastic/mitochondrial [Oryza brachyantha]|uniref:Exonuclease domain-containing protein n=1 Tax=Oryza brachyantha TaxID=4533 RepID=J3M1J8_ORYBR|nr:exonuclease DPD1, chloroplastic/mitochondrial [Oryza brachyantha]
MSSILRSSQLRNNVWSSFPVRFLKQQAGLSTAKLLGSRSCEIRHFTTQVQDLGKQVVDTATVLIFDVETTGFFHKDHRIIEFALYDLSGGKNSTFETLVNPERTVPNHVARVHNIGTGLVCRPDIPRFSDVIPLLLAYVRSRQAHGKPILWVAHNAKQFDARFLAQEFDRCSAPIPADWLFFDTLVLAKKMVKAEGKKRPTNLEALREHYGICSNGTAHRAMRDVMILGQVFQKMTFDLKLTYKELMNEAMRASEFSNVS